MEKFGLSRLASEKIAKKKILEGMEERREDRSVDEAERTETSETKTNEDLLLALSRDFEPCSPGFLYCGDSIPTFNGEKLSVTFHTREVRDRSSGWC